MNYELKYTNQTIEKDRIIYGRLQDFLIENGFKSYDENDKPQRGSAERSLKNALNKIGNGLKYEGNLYYPVQEMINIAAEKKIKPIDSNTPEPQVHYPDMEELEELKKLLEESQESEKYFESKAKVLQEDILENQAANRKNLQDKARKLDEANTEIRNLKRQNEANKLDDSEQTKAAKAEAKAANAEAEKAKAEAKHATQNWERLIKLLQEQKEINQESKDKTEEAEAKTKTAEAKAKTAEAKAKTAEAEAKTAEAEAKTAEAEANKYKNRFSEINKASNYRALIWLFIASFITSILTALVAYDEFFIILNSKIAVGFAVVFGISMITVNYYLPEKTPYQIFLKVLIIAFFTGVEFSAIALKIEIFTREYEGATQKTLYFFLALILPVSNLIFSTILSNRLHK
jgi:DNA polymerase III alpha subunit (gram-positive type)